MKAHYKVAVLTHARDAFDCINYRIRGVMEVWREWGIEVVVLRGIDRFEAADALILHPDLTVIPEDYIAFSARYPVVINGRVRDISKRKISRNLLKSGDSYPGEVIVKTNLNCAGLPEQKLARFSRLQKKLSKHLPWTLTGKLTPDAYPVFPSLAEVPKAVWYNPKLVVEKYLPERDGEYYCLRQWIFLGDRGISQCIFSLNPIVKAVNVVRRQYDLPVPDALRAMRQALGFDYGKFDYVMIEGEAVLLDANRTPTIGGNTVPRRQNMNQELAQGLYAFLDDAEVGAY